MSNEIKRNFVSIAKMSGGKKNLIRIMVCGGIYGDDALQNSCSLFNTIDFVCARPSLRFVKSNKFGQLEAYS